MAVADTANLLVKLSLGGNFASQLDRAGASVGKFEGKSNRAYKAGQQIGTGIKRGAAIAATGIGFLASQVAFGLDSLIKLESQEAQTAAVLKSTGGAARINGQQITDLANKYESLNATVGDEFVRAGENMLLTFTNIKGKGFEPALASVLDLNTAMGKGPEGLTKTAILVGKALNDPTKGLTALTRVGVNFDKGQIKRIKSLQKEGKLYEAQQIILKELNKEFGGSFAAGGNTTAGRVAKFGDAVEDLQRSLAKALLPTLGTVADALSKLFADPATIKGVEDIGKGIASLFSAENLASGAKVVGDAFQTLRSNLPAIKAGISGIATVVGGAVDAFRSLPPEIQALAVAGFGLNKLTGGLVTNIAGGLISSVLKQLVSGVVNVQGAVVNVTGAGGLPGGAPGLPPGALPGVVTPIIGALAPIGAILEYAKSKGTVDRKAFLELKQQGHSDAEALKILADKQVSAVNTARTSLVAAIAATTPTANEPDIRSERDRPRTKKYYQSRDHRILNRPGSPDDRDERHARQGREGAKAGDGRAERDRTPEVTAAVNRARLSLVGAVAIGASLTSKAARAAGVSASTAARTGGTIAAAAAKVAGRTAASGGFAASRSIDRKDLSVTVKPPSVSVSTNVNVSATTVVKKTVVVRRYGPTGGDRNTVRRAI